MGLQLDRRLFTIYHEILLDEVHILISIVNSSCAYRKDDQYTTFKIRKENGKKNRDILSMYNAVWRPLQKVAYCGVTDSDLMGLRTVGPSSCKQTTDESEFVWM